MASSMHSPGAAGSAKPAGTITTATTNEPATGVSLIAARAAWARRAGFAGMTAALAMVFAQLLWRVTTMETGAISFPETVVAAVSRLTPLGVFGWATENLGSVAQNTLFIASILGVLAVGYEAGRVAGWLTPRLDKAVPGAGRWLAAALLALVMLAIALLVIAPIANLGFFGMASAHGGQLLLQFTVTFALWAVLWPVVIGPEPVAAAELDSVAGEPTLNRRAALSGAAGGAVVAALAAGTGGLAWSLLRDRSRGDVVASKASARSIELTAEARASIRSAASGAVAAPTSAPLPAPPAPAAVIAAASPEAGLGGPSFTELQDEGRLTPRLTAVSDFYHVSKNISDPIVSRDGWQLTIGGLVDKPLTFTLDDLVARADVQRITTLCCISNEINGDLISTAEWTGVPLATLLKEAGVQANAVDLKFHCADDYEESVSVAAGMDPDNLVVVAMNGEPLPDDHGFPARLIVPAIYGMKNVKWLQSIELVDFDFQGYWQTRGWSDPAPYQIWGRIDTPAAGDDTPAGQACAAGMASAGDRGVQRVEISFDEGATWADTELEPSLNPPFTWVRWKYPFEAASDAEIWIRVTDGEGNVAPQAEQSPLPDGATGWPSRNLHVV